MKKTLAQIFCGLFLAASARADTPLTFGNVSAGGSVGPCWQDTALYSGSGGFGNFNLPGIAATGIVYSTVFEVINFSPSPGSSHLVYTYSVDMSALPAAPNHCVKLLVHFGSPITCLYDVMVFTNGSYVNLSSARKAPYGDITFQFGSGCLAPGQRTDVLGMQSDAVPKNGYVTIIDDYTDPASGTSNEVRISVAAIVPDVPPNWAYAPFPFNVPNAFFQGTFYVGTNQFLPGTNLLADFTLQLYDASSNGFPVSQLYTQTVTIKQGLFNVPLPFDPSAYTGPTRYLNLAVRPQGANNFTPLNPPLPLTPTPQAVYAYSAGVVADLAPGQAVKSLNGLTDNLVLQGGNDIAVTLNGDGKTILISLSQTPGTPSDRNLKTNFTPVNPLDVLKKVAALPVQSWRFTNEAANVRHLGPTAQDFSATFGLGNDDRRIGIVDEGGVALAAIQGLNQKLEEQVRDKDSKISDLEKRLAELEKLLRSRGPTNTGD